LVVGQEDIKLNFMGYLQPLGLFLTRAVRSYGSDNNDRKKNPSSCALLCPPYRYANSRAGPSLL